MPRDLRHISEKTGDHQDSPRQQRPSSERKRFDILRAATKSFFEVGFEATSIEQIAREAGVSKVTIYNQFINKEALFSASIARECEKIRATVALSEDSGLPLEQRLFSIGETIIDFLSRPEMIRFEQRISAETDRFPKLGIAFLNAGPRNIRTEFSALIRTWENQGVLRVANPDLAAEQFVAMCKGLGELERRFGAAPSKETNAARIHAAVSVFLKAYRKMET